MRTKRTLFLAVIGLAAMAQAAAAADLGGGPRRSIKDDPPPPFVPTYSWTGLYVGAHVGYGWSDVDWQFEGSAVNTGHSGSGTLAGGQIGYNFQMQQFVFGVEADISGSWLDGDTDCVNPAFSCGHSMNWLASLRGRAGIAVNGNRTLLYATAGGAWADVDYEAINKATGLAFGSGHSERHFGWVAGGGVEHMITPNITARIEYLYYGFDEVTASAGSLGTTPAALDLTTQTVRLGVNFKF